MATEFTKTTGLPLELPQWEGEVFQFQDVNDSLKKINDFASDIETKIEFNYDDLSDKIDFINNNLAGKRTIIASGLALYAYGKIRILRSSGASYGDISSVRLDISDRPSESINNVIRFGGFFGTINVNTDGTITVNYYTNYGNTASSTPISDNKITGQIVWYVN